MRADVYLFRAGYSRSRESARKSIEAGLVRIDGRFIRKPAADIDPAVLHTVRFEEACDFVGRGGLKLDFAMNAFSVNAEGLVCADIGASTGGFTDCLLRRGARRVYAVDAGHGQLDATLKSHPGVINLEGRNARFLSREDIPEECGLIVMDVSFISQTLIHPALAPLLSADGTLITLIKPQFEAGKSAVGKGGIVKKAQDRYFSALRVSESAEACGLFLCGLVVSPVTGGDGNLEYLALFRKKKSIFAIDRKIFD